MRRSPDEPEAALDWYLPEPDAGAVGDLRREISGYLGRHAAPGSDIDAAAIVVSELLTNGVRYARGPLWVSLTWTGVEPLLEVNDLGPGFVPDPSLPASAAIGGRGIYLAATLSADFQVAAKRAGGTRVNALLPVRRPPEESFASPPTRIGALPLPQEADAGGFFGRESFLRAMVVQLADALERDHGPLAVQQAVAAVGTAVGARMEEEHRRAAGLVGRLTPGQMADLYVGLKRAIDGDFYVVEASEERIVLGNRRCPFGEAVRAAPGLCRMTSSVFGGIASRSAGSASVLLEERIAVGDPECRVVVTLGAERSRIGAAEHWYGGAEAAGAAPEAGSPPG